MQTPEKITILYTVETDASGAARRAAQLFVETARLAVSERGCARIAISGGSTPKPVFELLSDPSGPWRTQMPWEKLEIFWVDERCVPPDHPESNYGMTREALLDRVPLKPEQVHRMEGELEPEAAAERYESRLRASFRLKGAELPCFDLIALGMGSDGHTASLFPRTRALHETSRLVAANQVPQKGVWRLTLTSPVINQGRTVFFLITDGGKAPIIHQVFMGEQDPEQYPSQLIWPSNGILSLILDESAAALLPSADGNGHGVLERER